MSPLVPHRFLFRFAFPLPRVDGIPGNGKSRKGAASETLFDLPAECVLPDIGELDGARTFGELRGAWNEHGLAFSLAVTGKRKQAICDANQPVESDGLQLWIDTRNTQNIHRASRFCHHFCVLPTGAGKGKNEPIVLPQPLARAREEVSLANSKLFSATSRIADDGYRLDVWLPASTLTGYEPRANPKLGFYYLVRDAEQGDASLTVGPEFPYAHDPSLWSTLDLVG